MLYVRRAYMSSDSVVSQKMAHCANYLYTVMLVVGRVFFGGGDIERLSSVIILGHHSQSAVHAYTLGMT